MKNPKPTKNLLVYADGRVEDANYPLEGMYFIKPEMVDGDQWNREFEIHLAHDGGVGTAGPKTCSMVGIEYSFRLVRTAAQIAKDEADRRNATMKKALWGIANYPGDESDG